jgi:hypothetical protein
MQEGVEAVLQFIEQAALEHGEGGGDALRQPLLLASLRVLSRWGAPRAGAIPGGPALLPGSLALLASVSQPTACWLRHLMKSSTRASIAGACSNSLQLGPPFCMSTQIPPAPTHRFCAELPGAFGDRLRPLLPFLLALRSPDGGGGGTDAGLGDGGELPAPAGELAPSAASWAAAADAPAAVGLQRAEPPCQLTTLLNEKQPRAPLYVCSHYVPTPRPRLQRGPPFCCRCCSKSATQPTRAAAARRRTQRPRCGWQLWGSPPCWQPWRHSRPTAPQPAHPPSPCRRWRRLTRGWSTPAACSST